MPAGVGAMPRPPPHLPGSLHNCPRDLPAPLQAGPTCQAAPRVRNDLADGLPRLHQALHSRSNLRIRGGALTCTAGTRCGV